MRGLEQSRRDDLESLGYVWLYLLRGSLPWQGLPAKNNAEKMSKILALKAGTPAEQLCEGFPTEFVQYFRMVADLQFDEEPDYFAMKQLFRELFVREGLVFDYVYDWTTKRPPPVKAEQKQMLALPPPPQPATQPPSKTVTPRDARIGRMRQRPAPLRKPVLNRTSNVVSKKWR
jgi:hypothetical protein